MNDSLLQSVTASAEQPVHDVRAVHDAVGLRFDGVGHGKGAWIVIKIIPAPHSGSATVIGASVDRDSGQMIDTATGDIISPRAVRRGIIEEGSWELFATVDDLSDSAKGGSRGQYSWTRPRESDFQQLKAETCTNHLQKAELSFVGTTPRPRAQHNSNRYTSYRRDGRQPSSPRTNRSSNLCNYLPHRACHRTMLSFSRRCTGTIRS
ncbi:MAG: hypothetical protein QOI29_4440 [Mycobacterium sp.]|jgi:hypothetical protein|nr:hypothetical protein [Mycobacterium sp.]